MIGWIKIYLPGNQQRKSVFQLEYWHAKKLCDIGWVMIEPLPWPGDRPLKSWCKSRTQNLSHGELTLLECEPAQEKNAVDELAKIIPEHYMSPEGMAHILKNLGKNAMAQRIKQSLPDKKRIRSGELGEILAMLYVEEYTDYDKSIKKLRWKDTRNMSMRGEDILVFRISSNGEPHFLKGEAKSASTLSSDTIKKARIVLEKNDNLPSPHALTFLASRLYEEGKHGLADVIHKAELKDRIKLDQVAHMIFIFSGNDPKECLINDLNEYKGQVSQKSVGLNVKNHQSFIQAVFEKATDNGND